MNSKGYKGCAVPLCKNTTKTAPHKLFIYVPKKKTVRDIWFKLAQRNPTYVSTNSTTFFCEDHFDLPNDMDNYMEYYVMGSVSQVRMKPGCIPRKFQCQPERKRQISTDTTIELPNIQYKKQKTTITHHEECEKQKVNTAEHIDLENIGSGGSSVQYNFEKTESVISKMDKSVQVNITKKFQSKASQTEVRHVSKITSPLKPPNMRSVSTSPFTTKSSACVSSLNIILKKKEISDDDISYTPSGD